MWLNDSDGRRRVILEKELIKFRLYSVENKYSIVPFTPSLRHALIRISLCSDHEGDPHVREWCRTGNLFSNMKANENIFSHTYTNTHPEWSMRTQECAATIYVICKHSFEHKEDPDFKDPPGRIWTKQILVVKFVLPSLLWFSVWMGKDCFLMWIIAGIKTLYWSLESSSSRRLCLSMDSNMINIWDDDVYIALCDKHDQGNC